MTLNLCNRYSMLFLKIVGVKGIYQCNWKTCMQPDLLLVQKSLIASMILLGDHCHLLSIILVTKPQLSGCWATSAHSILLCH